jgi:hypothetical protein
VVRPDGALHLTGGGKRGIGIDPTDPHVAIEVDNIDDTKRTLGVFYLDAPVLMARMNLSPEQIKVAGMQVWMADPEGNVLELQRRIDQTASARATEAIIPQRSFA